MSRSSRTRIRLPSCLVLLLWCAACHSQGAFTDLVHPLVGTAAQGQTFPATGVPFGMTDWTPQTRDGETKCVAPYYSDDTRIQGFRGSHFLSGSCTQDYGSFTVMPGSGRVRLTAARRASSFDHAEESATPSLYSVDLADYGIHAELTGTLRAGFMRFRFNRGGRSWIVVQSNARPRPTGLRGVHIDFANNEISGCNAVSRLYAGEGKSAGFSGYFIIQFDHRFQSAAYWNPTAVSAAHDHAGAHLSFELQPGETLQLRIGTSFTSLEEARRNLAAEIPDWNFNRVAAGSREAWEQALGRIQIAGGAPERSIFYTALYHAMLLPRTFSDASGTYPRFAGGGIEVAKSFTYYDDYSVWDTFRTLHPMLTILDPVRESDMVASLIAKGTQGGYLPIFPAWNSYTSEMIGDHAAAIIVDAYAKGIRGYDVAEAYRLLRHNALDTPPPLLYEDGRGRRALQSYLKYGYIPLEDHVPFAFHKDEQVSRTLEYAYDDFLIAQLASALGHTEDAAFFKRRSANWRNVIDPQSGFARGRHADGSWVTPFNPGVVASYITEGVPFQYTFFVPQDIGGLIAALDGPAAFVAKLNALFDKGLYDQGNEPSHHIAYLYNDAGSAANTQKHVREILDTKYHDRPDGLAGNDDAGQMSAWYVMSSLGFYPVTPGLPVYELSTPRFDDTTLVLANGRRLHISAVGSEAGSHYIASVTLNGIPLTNHTIDHEAIMAGGELKFDLRLSPQSSWPK